MSYTKQAVTRLTLDMGLPDVQKSISVTRGDTNRRLEVTLIDRGSPFALPPDWTAVLAGVLPGGDELYESCIVDNGRIIFDFVAAPAVSSEEGVFGVSFDVFDEGGEVVASPKLWVHVTAGVRRLRDPDTIDRLTVLQEFVGQINRVNRELEAHAEQIHDAEEALGTHGERLSGLEDKITATGHITIPATEWTDTDPHDAFLQIPGDSFTNGGLLLLAPEDNETREACARARISVNLDRIADGDPPFYDYVWFLRAESGEIPDSPLHFVYFSIRTGTENQEAVAAIIGVDAYGEGGGTGGGVDSAAVEEIVTRLVPGWARREEPPEESDPTVSDWAKAAKKPTYDKYDVGLSNVDNAKQYSTINPPPYPVTSVNGKEGAVSLAAEDVGADAAGSAQAVANQVAQDLQSYYSREEVDNLISAIPKFSIEVVASLPTSGISRTTVYLVKNKTDSGDLYTEYIYANGAWEELGRQRVDLSGYSTTTQMNTAISTALSAYITQNAADGRYAKKGDIPSKVSSLTNDAGYLNASAGDERYATLERLPTNVSQLTNDSGYLDTLAGDQRYAMAEDLPTLPSDIGAEPAGAAQAVAQSIANDLKSYYKKTDTYSRTEVDNLISAIPKFSIVTASSLPTSNISLTTVYLVKDKTSSGDLYTEYIYVNNAWEELGRQTVNLSGYVTLTKLNTALNDYALKANVPSKTSQLTNDSNFAVTTKAETWSFILSDGTVVTKKVVLA